MFWLVPSCIPVGEENGKQLIAHVIGMVNVNPAIQQDEHASQAVPLAD